MITFLHLNKNAEVFIISGSNIQTCYQLNYFGNSTRTRISLTPQNLTTCINLNNKKCIPIGCVPPTVVAFSFGGLPQCMLGIPPSPPALAWTPPGCGSGYTIPGCGSGDNLHVCGPGDPLCQTLQHPTGCGPGDPPVNRITNTCINMTSRQLRCGR